MDDDCEFDSGVEIMELLCSGDELLRHLAAAVRNEDKTEAEILLDKIADLLGSDAQEAVARGRFMKRPIAA